MTLQIKHDPEIDYVSINFSEGIEAKSTYQKGMILRFDKKGNVLGLDITNSSNFFAGQDTINLQDACQLLHLSESTLRRKAKEGIIPFKKPNGKDYRFKKSDILKMGQRQ